MTILAATPPSLNDPPDGEAQLRLLALYVAQHGTDVGGGHQHTMLVAAHLAGHGVDPHTAIAIASDGTDIEHLDEMHRAAMSESIARVEQAREHLAAIERCDAIATTLQAAADQVDQLDYLRLGWTALHHILQTVAPSHAIGQAALNALVSHLRANELPELWTHEHTRAVILRAEAAAHLRAAAEQLVVTL